MPETNDFSQLSRRRWLGLVSPPALAVSLAAGMIGEKALAAEPARAPGSGNDLGAKTYNVRDYGAKGDGTTLDTAAVQAAIDACAADGGGTVLVPSGVFHVGSIEMKSNVTLRIVASAKLLGSANGHQYHSVDAIPLHGDSTLEDGNWAFIFAVNAKNVTIEGPGMVDGQGLQFHPKVRGETPPSGVGGNNRPYHMLFYRCENLSVRNIDLFNSAYHSVRVIQCKFVHMDGLHIYNRVNGNNDGFHFISAEHVMVSNCTVQSQDDACALFGSCRFVTITNSTFSTRWSVFRFGGGTAENITVSNCILYQVYGCPIKFHSPGGTRMENISFSDIVLQDVTGPINFSVGPYVRRNRPAAATTAPGGAAPTDSPAPAPERPPGIVRNISFSNIHGTITSDPAPLADVPFPSGYREGELKTCITLNCVGNATLENISFDNIHLKFGGGGTVEEGARRELPQVAGEYFELGKMPAYGFYARNARALTLRNIRFEFATPDLRPAIILDKVSDVSIGGLSVQTDPKAESVLRFINTKQAYIAAPRVLTPGPAFLQLEGTENAAITIDGGDLSLAAAPTAFKNGATPACVKVRA